MKRNKISLAMLLGAGITVLSGCDNTANTETNVITAVKSTTLAKEQVLVRGNGTEVASLDPHRVEGVPEANVLRDLMEGLVIEDAVGNIIPGQAESWQTEDNQRFVFKIRADAKWSNGDPVTAQDFEYSFKRVVDPKLASPYAWYIEKAQIKNATAIINGKMPFSELGVKAIDDKTLEVVTEIPLPYFIKMMAHTTMVPVNKTVVEKFGDAWTKPENYVSNGAYKLSEWVVNEKIVLVRNENYWDNKDTVINQVTFLPIENQNAEMNRFLSGEIDITNEVPNEQFRRLKQERPNELTTSPYLCSYYYAFNNEKPPFNDVRVRKALSYLIDRAVVTNAILGKGEVPAYGLTHSGVTGFVLQKPDYANMSQAQLNEKAKALFAESGFSESNPLKFSLLYNTSENHKKVAIAIQSMWKKALGNAVDIELVNQEWKTFLDTRRQGNFDVTRAGWCADYNEASAFLAIGMTGNGNNDQRYSSEVFDKAMADAARAKTDEERTAFYVKAEAQMAQDMPIAPIYEYVRSRLVSTKVANFPHQNPQDNIYTKDLALTE